jgi:hypothetical protein
MALVALAVQCATAGPITWTPIRGGSSDEADDQPKIYTPIGNSTFGSDGSSGYRSGQSSVDSTGNSSYTSGNITIHSDGTRTTVIGDTMYGQKPDGSQFYCRLQGAQTVCYPR